MEALRQLCSSTLAALPGGVSQGVKVDAEALLPAVEFALRDGSAAQVYALLSDLYARVEVTVMPERLELVLVEHGLHPDALLSNGTCYLHHRLGRDIPPAKGLLQSILSKHPNTDLHTPSGDTALHLLVKRTLQRQYYPSSQIYGDIERAEYLTAAFPLMIQAHFSATATDAGGKSVVALLGAGYVAYAKAGGVPPSITHSAMLVAIRTSLERCGEAAPVAAAAAAAAAPGPQHAQRAGPSTPTAAAPAASHCASNSPPTQLQQPLLVPAVPPEDALEARMTFGKHEGILVSEVPYDYIEWMCRTEGFWDGPQYKQDLLHHLKALGRVRETDSRVVPVVRQSLNSTPSRKRQHSYDAYEVLFQEPFRYHFDPYEAEVALASGAGPAPGGPTTPLQPAAKRQATAKAEVKTEVKAEQTASNAPGVVVKAEPGLGPQLVKREGGAE